MAGLISFINVFAKNILAPVIFLFSIGAVCGGPGGSGPPGPGPQQLEQRSGPPLELRSGPPQELRAGPPLEQQRPAKMQYVPGGHSANQVNIDQGPVPAAGTNYDSYSSYGGSSGSSYGSGASTYGSGSSGSSYGSSGSGYGSGGGTDYGNDNYGFDCYGKKPALYGDTNYDCRIYHVCQADGRSDTLKCPKWTRFNNYLGICDWHFKVDNYCNPLPEYKSDSYGSGSGYQSGGSGYQQGASSGTGGGY